MGRSPQHGVGGRSCGSSAGQDDRSLGRAPLDHGGDQVSEALWVHSLSGGAEFLPGPPSVLADVVGLRGALRTHVARGKTGGEVSLDLANLMPAHQVGRAALGELHAQLDRRLVDAELFAKFAEDRRGVVLPFLEGASGRGPEATAFVVAKEEDALVFIEHNGADGVPHGRGRGGHAFMVAGGHAWSGAAVPALAAARLGVRYGTNESPQYGPDGIPLVNSPHDAASSGAFRLAVTGGGTGGHTYPALTTIRTLQDRLAASGRALEVLWIGSESGLEARIAPAEGIPFTPVATGKIRRSANPLKMLSAANMREMARVPLGVAQARKAISEFRPDVVLATDGYVAVPAGLAARLCRRPLVLHEQTVRLGLANRQLTGSATRIAVSSESTLPLLPEDARSIAVVTGNPVRPEVLSGHSAKAIEALGLRSFDGRRPTVYVTGGAQGAQQINMVVAEVLPWLLEHANVVHQCGPDHVEVLRQRAASLPAESAGRYYVSGFVGTELPDVLALADAGRGSRDEPSRAGPPRQHPGRTGWALLLLHPYERHELDPPRHGPPPACARVHRPGAGRTLRPAGRPGRDRHARDTREPRSRRLGFPPGRSQGRPYRHTILEHRAPPHLRHQRLRRRRLQYSSHPLASPSRPTDPQAAHSGGRRVSRRDLDELWAASADAQRWDSKYGGGTYKASKVAAFLRKRAIPLLDGDYTDAVGRELFAGTAELARVAGWSALDMGHHALAQRHFIQALRMARAGGSLDTGCHVLTTMALQATLRGYPSEAVDMAQGAYDRARPQAAPRVLAFAKLAEARAHARLGDTRSAAAALKASERLLERADTDRGNEPGWISYYTPTRMAADAVEIHRELGLSAAALRWNTRAGAMSANDFTRSVGLRMTVLATTHLQNRDLDQALAHGQRAVTILSHVRSTRATGYLTDVVRAMAPWRRDPRVTALSRQAHQAITHA